MIVFKLVIIGLLYAECYFCYRIVNNPFNEQLEEEDTSDDNDSFEFDAVDTVIRSTNYEENPEEKQSEFWQTNAQETLKRHLKKQQNENVAKNVIFFVGDGMSLTTLTAARIYSGQLQNRSGEEMSLSFEEFPHTGLSKTYCVDKQVADSACSGTALFTGVKINYNVIGVNGNVKLHDCAAAQNKQNHLSSIIDWAQREGKATGIVTTTGITSATPAAAYAHSAHRKYESDTNVLNFNKDPILCPDIAKQLVHNEPGKNLNVIFGGGRSKFLPGRKSKLRSDNRNLIEEWLKMKNGSGVYVSDRNSLKSLKLDGVNHVLGLFAPRSLPFNLETSPKYPSLAEMTESAINILKNIKQSNGYVLLVEAGRIDHGHHGNRARIALDETVQLSETVQQTVQMVDTKDTLIVVTSDHSHTMSFAGYNPRGGDVLGVAQLKNKNYYTLLSYANGPGYKNNFNLDNQSNTDISKQKRRWKQLNHKSVNIRNKTILQFNFAAAAGRFKYPALVETKLETHGGDDVGVFALGPWSHLFGGVYEQNVIPHLIAYAACIGDGLTVCLKRVKKSTCK